ncbi:kinesin-like protein KIF20B isoform X3 [Cynoglossus semilaevis]|uniref:kinesin-like protein KIF20B isoform X3 n=1 Tax=Cynoglossus semilaevis TaxID=244447 RepID=UPI0007DCAD80|nr:kinesin-like protein KIF20B isoform X3 [Cynoglossus semilaevis]
MPITAEDRITLDVERHTKFSVWVSFCEIYNENIHDLLEPLPIGTPRRTILRLSQDVKGNAFVKDLRWVQVNNAEEAFRVMKLGKKNQSFSSTRLNQVSSRSHSIFSIRILRIEDVATQRVHTVSEFCLCDLAGSERCAKTQNIGERLKEAGNINTSLLTLGKCINALRHNQQAKLLQHVPFRESKLTHYLQSFFCGRGKACMIVNINQCASMYDETLNVLKFSAVAQKVVVLTTRLLTVKPQSSATQVSFGRDFMPSSCIEKRRSSLIGWESSLEDVQEDLGDEHEQDGSALMEDTLDLSQTEGQCTEDKILISKHTHQKQVALLNQLQHQLKKERAEGLLTEARIREEICGEFTELIATMQKDFSDRLAREKEILEERAEHRMEIFKKMINNMTPPVINQDTDMEELSALEKEKKARADVLVALEFQTQGKEEALATVKELRRDKNEAQAALEKERSEKKDANFLLEKEKKEVIRLTEENKVIQQQVRELKQEIRDLSAKQDTAEHQVTCERDRTAQTLVQLHSAQEQLDQQAKEIQEKNSQIHLFMLKAENASDLRRKTADDSQHSESAELRSQLEYKELELVQIKEELKQMKEKLDQQHKESAREFEDLKTKLQNQEESRSRLEHMEHELVQAKQEREKVCQHLDASNQEIMELRKKLQEQENIRSQLEHQELELSETKEKLELVNEMLCQHQARSNEQINELRTNLQEMEEIRSKLKNQELPVEATEELGKMEKVSQQCEESTQKIDELTAKLQKEEENRPRLEQLENELAQVRQERDEVSRHCETLTQQINELRTKLQEEEKIRSMLKHQELELSVTKEKLDQVNEMLCQQRTESTQKISKQQESEEQLRKKLEEQTQTCDELKQKLQKQQVESQKDVDELKHKQKEQQETSDDVIKDLKLQLKEAQLQASSTAAAAAAEEELKKLNSELQTEVSSLRSKVACIEEVKDEEKGKTFPESSELQKKLLEKEAEVTALQKSLRDVEERKAEEEMQAVQEARRREAERRRELLAVAHEAIAQKDEELEKKSEEISRLKEMAKQDAEKVTSLNIDLQRKEEETSDVKEKLADYKKQIQQVQKEISAMREEEKLLRQKLNDADKTKKQLQSDIANRDRTIQQLKGEHSAHLKSDHTQELYQKACKDLEAKERVMEDMRLALTEQEETQAQMEEMLEEKLGLIQELTDEVGKLKTSSPPPGCGRRRVDSQSHDPNLAKQEAAQAQQQLKLCEQKHQTERKKWLEEKLSLIGQAKEAEDKRNQEMRKFVDDRERYGKQQSHLESELQAKEEMMQTWRKERDTLVSALEVQLHKLLSSQSEKDREILELKSRIDTQPTPECGHGGGASNCAVDVAELQATLQEREKDLQKLKDELKKLRDEQKIVTKTKHIESTAGKLQSGIIKENALQRTDNRMSVSSQASSGFPSVLDSSEISTENGRTSRFPRPELEISFSPLQPNRMALRRRGDDSAVTVKITRSARKRRSGEMEKSHIFRRSKRRTTPEEEVEAQNRRNTKTNLTPKLTPHQEEVSSSLSLHGSSSSIRSRKEGTLLKIGEFLQSSPTLFSSKAKKMMSLVSSRNETASASSSSSSSMSLKTTKNKRKLFRPEISSPMDLPSHNIINMEAEERDSDHQIIKRRLRSRIVK